jgi:hypothetical protein
MEQINTSAKPRREGAFDQDGDSIMEPTYNEDFNQGYQDGA